ncbi:MAG: hypothetical protein LUD72_08745 [Bacteroidales bacterium]|nr:hypothetical protein [Bacteroidales bacterium]
MARDRDFSKEYKLNCPFPVPAYIAHITYREIKKPSGFAYILLELIDNSSAVKGRISDVLQEFGIPEDLHYIFAKEMVSLMSSGVVQSYFYDKDSIVKYFGMLKIEDFSMTNTGREFFKEQAIPTGDNKYLSVPVYYNVVKDKFSTQSNSEIYIDDSPLAGDTSLFERIEKNINTDAVEDLVEEQKTQIGLKKEEKVIPPVKIDKDRWLVTKSGKNMTLTFSCDGLSFSFNSDLENNFAFKYYDTENFGSIISGNPGLKFSDNIRRGHVHFENLDFIDLFIPGEIQSVANRPCSLYVGIASDDFSFKSEGVTACIENEYSEALLSVLGENVLFAHFTDDGECHYYVANSFDVPCDKPDGRINVNLILSYAATDSQKAAFLRALKDICMDEDVSPDYGGVIVYLDKIGFGVGDNCREYTDRKLEKASNSESKIELFLKTIDAISGGNKADEILPDTGRKLYDGFISDTSIQNVGYKYQILKDLVKRLNITQRDHVSNLASKFVTDDNAMESYETFINMGVSQNIVLSSVNVIKAYVQCVLNNEETVGGELARKFDSIRTYVWALNDMLGIKSYKGEIPNEDGYDANRFITVCGNMEKAFGGLKGYRDFDKIGFGQIDAYLEIYVPIRDTLVIEREAQKNVANVNRKYIDDLISKGRLNDAVCNLFIKLQDILAKMLKMNVGLGGFKLIEEASNRKVISNKVKQDLHELRLCRNKLQHLDERIKVDPTIPLLKKWASTVFSIEEENSK